MTLELHKDIYNILNFFIETNNIPNIIFHGPNGCGKRTIVSKFVNNIYNNDKDLYRSYVMNVNCAHGKGIKFIRDELKFFAKTHINYKGIFKTIILANADKLTIDAQSALRRCIESFSHTTRFFIIVDDKYKLLKPILSRFCEIYVTEPIIDNKNINLHNYMLKKNFTFNIEESIKHQNNLKRSLNTLSKNLSTTTNNKAIIIIKKASELYERGFSGIDIITYIENSNIEIKKKYQYLLCFQKIKKDFRNEKLLLALMLNFIFLRSDIDLENISFI
jgi:DNA polymerase III delta prime subunit